MRTTLTFSVPLSIFGSLLFVLPYGCGGSDNAAASSTQDGGGIAVDGGTLLPDGAILTPDGAVVPAVDAGPSGPPPGPGAAGCQALAVQAGATVDNTKSDVFTWFDATCHPRIAPLFRNDVADGLGGKGGFARSFTYDAAGATHKCTGSGTNGWQGFGYVVSHSGNGGGIGSNDIFGKYRTALAGKHHAIHEFSWHFTPGGGPVDVTVQYFFATGRSNPVWSITYDSTPAGADKVYCDARAPYSDIAFDDGKRGAVDGIGWGDNYKFVSTALKQVTSGFDYSWDYTQPNTIPYVLEWSVAGDAEMGLVQTQSWNDKEAGGDYAGGAVQKLWGKTGDSALHMDPANAGNNTQAWWPYQMNQYELPFGNFSHRLAWGASFGAVGHSSYTAFGKTLSGYPYQSYSVYVVLGKHSANAVAAQVAEMETVQKVKLTATRGKVATSGPRMAGTDQIPFTPAGFDPVYGAWTLDADANTATARVDLGSATLQNPVFELRGYTSANPPAAITFGGKTLAADNDYFATVDATGKRLWITLNATITGSALLTVD